MPEPGIPRVSRGTKEPVQAALLAVSGAAKPLIEPLADLNEDGLLNVIDVVALVNQIID